MLSRVHFIKVIFISVAILFLPFCKSISNSTNKTNILLIGDSISIGYLPFVQELMPNKVAIDRIPLKLDGKPENCQGTIYGLANMDRWLGNTHWDLIHFNFGLHDIKHVNKDTRKNSNDPNDPPQSDLIQYEKNLTLIVKKLKATGAKLIFATTTPYPKGTKPYREYGDEIKYNDIAKRIMIKHGIKINDLHAFVLPRMEELQRPVNVHFAEVGSRALAEQVALSINENLKLK